MKNRRCETRLPGARILFCLRPACSPEVPTVSKEVTQESLHATGRVVVPGCIDHYSLIRCFETQSRFNPEVLELFGIRRVDLRYANMYSSIDRELATSVIQLA